MASSWGLSWGGSWANSWGAIATRQPGGGYPVGGYRRPVIYVDDKGRPVDLKTFKARKANEALQSTKEAVADLPVDKRPAARAVVKALREAVGEGDDRRVADAAHRLAVLLANERVTLILDQLERAAREAADDEETALLLLVLAA